MSRGNQLQSSYEAITSLQDEKRSLIDQLRQSHADFDALCKEIDEKDSKISRMGAAFVLLAANVAFLTIDKVTGAAKLWLIGDHGLDEEEFEFVPEERWEEAAAIFKKYGFEGIAKWIKKKFDRSIDVWIGAHERENKAQHYV